MTLRRTLALEQAFPSKPVKINVGSTMVESGPKGFEVAGFQGVLAPALMDSGVRLD